MKKMIPILDLKREYSFLKKDVEKQVKECFQTQAWINGPKVKELEAEISAYLKSDNCVSVASGTDALVVSLAALALKLRGKEFFDKKDEIITTPFTFVATGEAIVRAGAKPVFVDVDPLTYNINPQEIEKAITKNTVGIIPVHLFGLPCDMSKIMKLARKYKLFVVEDTAQAFGAEYKGKKAGTIGDMGAFSFFPSKNLGGCGDGGMISAADKKLAESARIFKNHGQIKKYDARIIGINSRLDSLQAAILSVKLKQVDAFNRKRREIAARFSEAFSEIPQVKVPFEGKNYYPVYHLYTLRVEAKRDDIVQALNDKNIGARVYYQKLLSDMTAFKGCKIKGKLSSARDLSRTTFSMPLHPFMTETEINHIINNFVNICKNIF